MEQIKMQRKDAISLIKLLIKGFRLNEITNEVTAKIIDGYMYITIMDSCHVMFANIKIAVESQNKSIKINLEDLNEIQNSNEEIVSVKVDEVNEVKEYKLPEFKYNKTTMKIKEFVDLIRVCELMECDRIRITDHLMTAYVIDDHQITPPKTRIIKGIESEIKQGNNDISISCNILSQLKDFLRDFVKDTTMEFYFGVKEKQALPVMIKFKNNKNEFEIYIVPTIPKKHPPIIDSKYV
jgi:hypothetical protein